MFCSSTKKRYHRLKAVLAICAITISCCAKAQRPEISVQTGFIQSAPTSFEFSNDNRYLYGYSELNEHIIWDLGTSRQIKRISTPINAIPTLFYLPKASFSNDGNLLLIPDFPNGDYILFSLRENKERYRFTPPAKDLHYTHAIFSGKSDQVLLVLQSNGNAGIYFFEVRDISGKTVRYMRARFEGPFDHISELTKSILAKSIAVAEKTALIKLLAADSALKQVAVVTTDDRVYHFNMTGDASGDLSIGSSYRVSVGYTFWKVKNIRFVGADLALLLQGDIKKAKDETTTLTDTLLYVDAATHKNPRRKTSRIIVPSPDKRSNSLQINSITTDAGLRTYFEEQRNDSRHQVVAKDFATGKTLFSFNSERVPWSGRKTVYHEGRFDGGKLAAISYDRTKLAECSWDVLVRNIPDGDITNQLSPSRGTVKLFRPFFIDSTSVYIPRLAESGFLFNMKEGNVYNLGTPIVRDDTTVEEQLSFYRYENVSELDLTNAQYDRSRNSIAQVTYRPLDSPAPAGYKRFIEIPLAPGATPTSIPIKHNEETYSLLQIPGTDRLVVNSTLFQPRNGEMGRLQDLVIKEKRDSFFAIKPQLLNAASGTIFSVLCTRSPKGSPDLLFATWSKNGELLEKVRIDRKSNGYPSQSYVFEATLSPDKKYLLFALYDGTIGIYSLEKKAIIREQKPGGEFKITLGSLLRDGINMQVRLSVLSGCFVSNTRYVTAGVDSKLLEWDINKTDPIRQINQDERHMLLTIDRSPDGKFLYGVDIDKSVKFINYQTGEVDFRFLAPDHQSYLVVNKEGYYMTNKNSVNNLAYLYNGITYNFSQFDATLNRPDKLLQSIGYTSQEKLKVLQSAKEMQLESLGISAKNLSWANDLSAPVLVVNDSTRVTNTAAREVVLSLEGTDKKSALATLHVSVNGIPIYGIKGKPVRSTASAGGFNTRLQATIPLSDGLNEITLWLTNAKGVESLRSFRRITRTASAEKPDLYIVAIGAGKYKEPGVNLHFAAKDAREVVSLFSNNKGQYGKIIPLTLYDEQVMREALRGLKEKLQHSKVNDRVIVYYAGHGLINARFKYYLGTYDIDFHNPDKRGIAYTDLENLVDSIPARFRLLLLDACHSGDFNKEEQEAYGSGDVTKGKAVLNAIVPAKNDAAIVSRIPVFDIMRQQFVDIEKGAGATIIASSSSREYSWEDGDRKNGLFTHCLLEGCQSGLADIDKDGQVSVSELNRFLNEMVTKLSDGRQKPTSRAENTLLDFAVYPSR